MPFVLAAPEAFAATATDLVSIGSALTAASKAAATATTGVPTAGAD
ncbi:PE domain-containing protein [Mycobacterium lacus]|nr:PE domain-containing protein [Mycobacterium lacus]MCV7125005.1 PE domain-containing protein [Mycobacterium lacus]